MPLLTTLKQATAQAHQDLEKSMDVFRKVRSVDDYRGLLQRFYALYEPLEKNLGRTVDWSHERWDFDGRRKIPLLMADLKALDCDEPSSLLVRDDVPAPASLAEAIGVLYVLEGSTLGGQMISKQFGETLGITSNTGGRFFSGYGVETGLKWREFGQWAEAKASVSGKEFDTAAVRGAQATFEAFGRGLS